MTNYLANNNYTKVVYQIDKNTNEIISEYFSYEEAERETGICSVEISKACRGINKTSGGYKWESVGLTKNEDINLKMEYISKTYFFNDNVEEEEYE